MRVLLVSPNVESLPDPVFPLGLAQVAGALKAKGFDYRVLDLCFAEDFEEAIRLQIEDFRPEIVALSLRNVDNVSYPHYTSYLPFYGRVVQCVRRHSDALVVAGGSGFSLLPEAVLGHIGADIGVVGEGEEVFPYLLERIGRGMDRGNGPVLIQEPRLVEDLDALPDPDRSGFDEAAYLKLGGMGNIQTKRGCPFDCIYCVYPLVEGRRVRVRSPGRVCDEMERLLASGVDNLFIVDNTFNYPVAHAEAVCREILRRRLKVRWSCYVNPGFFTADLAALMQEAGCTGVEFGTDAGHGLMLENLRKNFTLQHLKEASRACREQALPFCHSLILGGPGETLETARTTLEEVRAMEPTAAICMVGIRVFPRTGLARVAEEEGLVRPGDDYLGPVFYLSRAVEDEILPFIEEFAKQNPTWILPGLHINMDERLQKKVRRFGIRGPLWTYMRRGERFRRRK